MALGRRSLLAGIVGASLAFTAGCGGRDDRIDDIVVYNETNESRRGSLTVKRGSSGETVFEDEFHVAAEPGASVSFGEPVDDAGKHEVLVTVDTDRTEQFTWDVPGTANGNSQDEVYGLQILVRTQSIEFKQISDGAD